MYPSASQAPKELVYLRSLVGQGKSCLLRSVTEQLGFLPIYQVVFCDLTTFTEALHKAQASVVSGNSGQLDYTNANNVFAREFNKHIFDTIIQFLPTNDVKYIASYIYHSDYERKFIGKIERKFDTSINSNDDLVPFLSDPLVQQWMDNYDFSQSMQSIFDYFKLLNRILVIVLDNVDLYPISFQQQVCDWATDWARQPSVKCVVAIRECNFQRLCPGVGGNIAMRVSLDPIVDEKQDQEISEDVGLEKIKYSKLLKILEKRIELLEEHLPRIMFRSTSKNSFTKSFLRNIAEILDELLNAGIYEISNYCLRTLMPAITRQALRIAFGPENVYYKSLKKNIKEAEESLKKSGGNESLALTKGFRSKLHSFFYKILMDEKRCIPDFSTGMINIFSRSDDRPLSTELILLQYLLRRYEMPLGDEGGPIWLRAVGVTLSTLDGYGYSLQEVEAARIRLTDRSVTKSILGFIERHDQYIQHEEATGMYLEQHFAVLPAGRRFAEQLMLTCEYAFWAALDTEIDAQTASNILTEELRYADVRFNESTKLDILLGFLRYVTLPRYWRLRMKFIEGKFGKTWMDYIDNICLQSTLFPIRLLNNIHRWIGKTGLESESKNYYRDRCDNLLNAFNDIQVGTLPAILEKEFTADAVPGPA